MAASGKQHGRLPHSMGFAHLARFAGSSLSAMQQYLYPQSDDAVAIKDDFVGPAINTGLWTTNNGGGTGAGSFATPATPDVGGTVAAATGTANGVTAAFNLYGAPIWTGTKNCGMKVRFKVSAITALQFFVGFVDTITTITTPTAVIPDIDTPSFASGAGDVAGLNFDPTQTLTTGALACLGSSAVNAGSKTAIGTWAPTADTFHEVVIQLVGNDVFCMIDNNPATTVWKTSGIKGATLVRPIIQCTALSASSRTMTLDLMRLWHDR